MSNALNAPKRIMVRVRGLVFGLLQIEPYLKGEPTRLLLEVRLGSDAAQQTTFKATRTTRTPPRSTPSAS